MYEQVKEFMQTFGQEIPTDVNIHDEESNNLRISLIREEILELEEAFLDDNEGEMRKEIADLRYVLDGAVVAWGLTETLDFHYNFEYSPNKKNKEDLAVIRAYFIQTMKEKINSIEKTFAENLALKSLYLRRDLQTIYYCILSLLISDPTFKTFQDDYNLVHKNNMSKASPTEEWAVKTIEAYKSGTHPSKLGEEIDTYFEKSGDYFIIKRTSDHKVMKDINYKKISFHAH